MTIKEIKGNGTMNVIATPKVKSPALQTVFHFKNIQKVERTKDRTLAFQLTNQNSDRHYLNNSWYTITKIKGDV